MAKARFSRHRRDASAIGASGGRAREGVIPLSLGGRGGEEVRGTSPGKFYNPRLSEKRSECLLKSFIGRNFDENLVIFFIFTFYFIPFSRE